MQGRARSGSGARADFSVAHTGKSAQAGATQTRTPEGGKMTISPRVYDRAAMFYAMLVMAANIRRAN